MIKVNIDNQRINNRLSAFTEKLYPAIKQQIKKGADRYTPHLSGDLQDSADPSARDSTQYLIYDVPYAKYQYYANGGAPTNDFPNRTRTFNPDASMLWVEKYRKGGGDDEIQRCICDNAAKILKF